MNLIHFISVILPNYLVVCYGARILAIETRPSRSHWIFLSSVLKELSTRHEITVMTPFLNGNRQNYTEVNSTALFQKLAMNIDVLTLKQFESPLISQFYQTYYDRMFCDKMTKFKLFEDVVEGKQVFDVILLKPLYAPCTAYIGHKLNIPKIYLVPSPNPTYLYATSLDENYNPSYESNLYFTKRIPRGFLQILNNFILCVVSMFIPWLVENSKKIWDPKLYDIEGVHHNPSLVFINSHPVTNVPRQLPLNAVEIGGIHLKPPKQLSHVSNINLNNKKSMLSL